MEIHFYSSRDGQRFYATYTPTKYMMIDKSNLVPRLRNIWPPLEEDEDPVYEKSMEIEDMEPERLEKALKYFVETYLLDILEEHGELPDQEEESVPEGSPEGGSVEGATDGRSPAAEE